MSFEISSPAADAFRSTVRAYLQPLAYARSFVGICLRTIRPSAGSLGVNALFGALLLAASFAAGTFTDVRVTADTFATEIYRTALGETRSETLEDGSSVQLAPLGDLRVRFTKHLRNVALVSGEAYFEVAHDASRPFLVRAGDNVVSVLGTRFDVRAMPNNELTVAVNEGVVAVFRQTDRSRTDVPRGALRLVAGQVAHVRSDGVSVRTLSQTEIDNRLAWRERRFVFAGESLATVIQDLNRFSTRRYVIDDPSIANRAIGGALGADELDDLTELLQYQGVSHRLVEREGGQEIHLFAASDAEEPHGNPGPR